MSNSESEICVSAVVVAAGVGSRMRSQTPKQYLPLAGSTVLDCSLQKLLAVPGMQRVVVVLAADDEHWRASQWSNDTRVMIATGGVSRAKSVVAGLAVLAQQVGSEDVVLVHDAARPCVRVADIIRLIDATANTTEGGLLAWPVTDTLKRTDELGVVQQTIDRHNVWRAATPQLFRLHALQRALDIAPEDGDQITDESSAMELAGFMPQLIACASDNIKITTPGDLARAERYLAQQKLELERTG